MIKNLSEEESNAFLADHQTGHLGCVLENGGAYVVPVNYLFENGGIYIHSLPGKKITAMEMNTKVCLQIDEMADDGLEWKSVIAFGEFERIDEESMKMKVINKFFKKFPRFTPVEGKFEDADTYTVVFCIKIKKLTGLAERY